MPNSTREKIAELTKREPVDNTLDDRIKEIAHMKMGDVLFICENEIPHVSPNHQEATVKHWLACQMFTDAIFNGDIRIISTIINRIDGGLPKDTELSEFQTAFGDCINELLDMKPEDYVKLCPTDSVMMAMSKSILSIATQDIYHHVKEKKDGTVVVTKKKPSPEAKQARDAALRIILERAGGKKSTTAIKEKAQEVEVADWIKGALPQG